MMEGGTLKKEKVVKTNSESSGVKQEGMKEQLEMCKMRYGEGLFFSFFRSCNTKCEWI